MAFLGSLTRLCGKTSVSTVKATRLSILSGRLGVRSITYFLPGNDPQMRAAKIQFAIEGICRLFDAQKPQQAYNTTLQLQKTLMTHHELKPFEIRTSTPPKMLQLIQEQSPESVALAKDLSVRFGKSAQANLRYKKQKLAEAISHLTFALHFTSNKPFQIALRHKIAVIQAKQQSFDTGIWALHSVLNHFYSENLKCTFVDRIFADMALLTILKDAYNPQSLSNARGLFKEALAVTINEDVKTRIQENLRLTDYIEYSLLPQPGMPSILSPRTLHNQFRVPVGFLQPTRLAQVLYGKG